jgi:hypothetical protein
MSYFPIILGLAVACGLIVYVEVTLRRERLSGLRARQSIIDRRLLTMKSALERIERRLDAMTVDREAAVASPDKASITKQFTDAINRVNNALSSSKPQPVSPSRRPCLDCGSTDAHAPVCALSMDDLVESPMDAAARRGHD